jgi:diguanylate cyclase (GGDEF)-like protein/PAS domain S-box-containing protein
VEEQDPGSILRWAGGGLIAVGFAVAALLGLEQRALRAELLLPMLGMAAGVLFLWLPGGRDRRQRTALQESEARFQIVARATNDAVWDWDLVADHIAWNEGLRRLFGYSAEEASGPSSFWIDRIHPEDRERVVDGIRRVQRGRDDEWEDEYRFQRRGGDHAVVLDRGTVIRDPQGRAVRMVGGMTDLSERRRTERFDADQRAILTGIAARVPLPETLAAIARLFEAQYPRGLCTILLLDESGAHVRHGAAPSLPASFVAAIDGAAIGPNVGSCGTAAWRGERVVVTDIERDPLWADWTALAREYGLKACWSTPVLSSQGKVLATFAVYYREPCEPQADELRTIDNLAAMTAIAIEQDADYRRLMRSEQRFRSLFEEHPDAVYSMDLEGRFTAYNRAFHALSGHRNSNIFGTSFDARIAPEHREHVRAQFAAAAAGQARTYEATVLLPDESRARMRVTNLPMVEDGTVTGVFGIAHDLTRERAAQARSQLLERAVESSASAIVIADAQQPDCPIIFTNAAFERMTGYPPEETLGRNCRFLQGADTRQDELELVRHALATDSDCNVILRNYRRDGALFWNHVFVSPVRDDAGRVTHYLGVLNDLTERRQVEAELAWAASHDAVTGLPRYPVLESQLATLLSEPGASAALYFIDLDRFHAINESMGHVFGDAALHIVAERLREATGAQGQVARFAGDEFVAMRPGDDEDGIVAFGERLRDAVARPIEGDGYRLVLTASIGISRAPRHGRSAMDLLRRAEAAMSRAKRQGRDALCEFASDQMQEMEDRLLLGARLREAPRRGELELHYQPLIEAGGRRVVGFEALLRWSSPQLGQVSPARFIPIAEALGLMGEIGHWVIHEACRQLREWQDAGLAGFNVAVNFSAQELQRPDIVSVLRDAVQRHGIEASRLEIEITESSLMEHVDRVVAVMKELKSLGVSLSLDDFGTGYSSLAYLKQFALDKIKIDRTFVRDLPQDADDAAIARTIVVIGHQLRLKVVAEGVETPEQESFLRAMGCDQLQGYLFSPAVPAARAIALLQGLARK